MLSTDILTTILGVVLLVLIVMLIIVRKKRKDPLQAIPGPKPFPIIGNVYEMVQIEAVDLFLKWCAEYGKIFKYKVFILGTQIMVSDAEAIRHILITNNSNYKKPESLLMPVRKIFGSRCVICLSPHEHAIRRKILNPAFNTSSIRKKAVSICDNTNRLLDGWQTDSVVQIEHDLSRLTLDILGDCIFGYNFDCIDNPDNKLTAALYRLMSVQDMNILRFLPFYSYLPTRINRDLKLIKSFVQKIIRLKQQSVRGESQTDMLDLMLQSRDLSADSAENSNKRSLTNDDIIDDIILFLVAGHETATNVLCWTLYELAKHSDIQQQCREEVRRVVSEEGPLQYDTCKSLMMVECCIKEAMRLYPPVPLTCRQNIIDDTLGGYYIPAGTVIALQLGAMMRHGDYFTEPESFLPTRFLNETHQQTFLPFLAGPDMCIGNKFAMLEMKLIVAVILSKYSLELTADADFSGAQGLTYHMKPPLYLKLAHADC